MPDKPVIPSPNMVPPDFFKPAKPVTRDEVDDIAASFQKKHRTTTPKPQDYRPVNIEGPGGEEPVLNPVEARLAKLLDRTAYLIPGGDFGSVQQFNSQLSGSQPRLTEQQHRVFFNAGLFLQGAVKSDPALHKLVGNSFKGPVDTHHLAAFAAAMDEYHTGNGATSRDQIVDYMGSKSFRDRVDTIANAMNREPVGPDADARVHRTQAPTAGQHVSNRDSGLLSPEILKDLTRGAQKEKLGK